MEEEVVESGSDTTPVQAVPTLAEPPPPRRSRPRSSANLYTMLGLGLALLAAGAYFFLFLRPARQRALEEIARFSLIEGEVKVKASQTQKWAPAKVKMILRAGDVVQTAPLAGAELAFKTGNIVRLRPDSVVLIGDTADTSEATWRVQSGQVNFELAQKTEIATPSATTRTAANSEGNISVEESGDTGIKIFKGSAQVATVTGQNIVLNENEAVKVDAKGQAGKKVVLPVPPQTVAPPTQAELEYKEAPDTVARLEWKPVAGGATYRVAMDYNVVQANLLLSAALDQPGVKGTQHELKGLEPGKYYWRVAGVNEDGVEGKYSKVANFAVVQPPEPTATPTPAEVRIDPLEVMGGVVALRGRAAPGSTVTVDGVEIGIQPDGSFSEFLKRGDRREITIKVTGPGGEVTEERRPVS
jgi:hypothetical protein